MTTPSKLQVRYVIVGNTVTITCQGKSHSILPDHPKYMEILKAIHTKKIDIIPKLLDIKQMIVDKSDGLLNVKEGMICLDGAPLPLALGKKVDALIKSRRSWTPLKLFWQLLSKNPDPKVKEQLYGFLEHNGHPITSDGYFLAYKKVKKCDDGTFLDLHSGTVKYEIGKPTQMKRADVNPNPKETCSRGLHAAAYRYASESFGSGSDPMIELKINPENVCAVPEDYNAEKMRCCEVFTVGLCNGPRKAEFVEVEQKTKRDSAKVQKGTLKPLSSDRIAALPKRDAKGRFIKAKLKISRKKVSKSKKSNKKR